MIHNCWAFDKNSSEKHSENLTEFARLKKAGYLHCENHRSDYNRFTTDVVATAETTALELMLYADDGNLCFGGSCYDETGKTRILELDKVLPAGRYQVSISTDQWIF